MPLPTSQDEAAALAILSLAAAVSAIGRILPGDKPLTVRHATETALASVTLALIVWGGVTHYTTSPIAAPVIIAIGSICGRFTDRGYSLVRFWVEQQKAGRRS